MEFQGNYNLFKLKSAKLEYSDEKGKFLLYSHIPGIDPYEFSKEEMKKLITRYMENSKTAFGAERDILNIMSDDDADKNDELLDDHEVMNEVFIEYPEKGLELRFRISVYRFKVYHWLNMFYYPKGSTVMKMWKGGCLFSLDENVVEWRKFVNAF